MVVAVRMNMDMFWISAALLFCIPWTAAQTTVCLTQDKVSTDASGNSMTYDEHLKVGTADVDGSGNLVDPNGISYFEVVHSYKTTAGGPVYLKISKAIEVTDRSASPDTVQVTVSFDHASTSTFSSISNISFYENTLAGLLMQLGDSFSPGIFNVTNNLRQQVWWTYSNSISPGSSTPNLSYYAEADDDGLGLPSGRSYYPTDISFVLNPTSVSYGPVQIRICVLRVDQTTTSIFYQHGFTALMFFIGLLLGIGGVILVVFLLIRVCRKGHLFIGDASVSPDKTHEKKMREKGKRIMLDAKAALKKGYDAVKNFSMISADESITPILALKDKLQIFREIDNLDILTTIETDTTLEREQVDASVQATILLVQGLRFNRDISKQMEDKALGDFQSKMKALDKHLQGKFQQEMESVFTDLSAKNKEKYGDLIKRHRLQKQQLHSRIKDVPEKEKKAAIEMLEQEQQTEEDELTYILALEQNEEAERLRKEFAVRRRMEVKDLQAGLLEMLRQEGQLPDEKVDWLLKEHKRNQDAIHKLFDEEISRQRMTLEEKLAHRRALAQAAESQDDDQTDTLNTIAGHQIGAIQKMRKQTTITDREAEEYMQQVKTEMLQVKERLDRERARQEADLHAKLTQLKKQRLAEKRKQQEQEVADFEKRCKAEQTEGPVDPVTYAKGYVGIRSNHRLELAALENDLDKQEAEELQKLRDSSAQEARADLKENEKDLLSKLQSAGMSDVQMKKMLSQHEKELTKLQEQQRQQREEQKLKLQKELEKRQLARARRKEQEEMEQEQLREHEDKVANKLINGQMSISDEERNRIMKEHEKQMVTLENSLTLNKIRQQRMLEERLAKRRAQQMARLQQKQDAEVVKRRKAMENNGEESDEESHKEEVALMMKHAEQRMAVLQGRQINLEDELEQIRVEMTKERALALKGQEERLGAMIAALQMEKARELARIEEQQAAIASLKSNLMDDLTDRGILSSPECERIIRTHQQEQELLAKKIESQRLSQEKMLRKELEKRMKQKEEVLLRRQQSEMSELLAKSPNKTAAKIRQVMLMQKHMVEVEHFRNQLEREISQALEEKRRQLNLIRMKHLQEQELHFIAGLVRVGKFQREELVTILQLLFPGRPEEEVLAILAKVYDDSAQGKASRDREDADRLSSSDASSLADRFQRTQMIAPSSRPSSRAESVRTERSLKRKGGSAKGKRPSSASSQSTDYRSYGGLDTRLYGSGDTRAYNGMDPRGYGGLEQREFGDARGFGDSRGYGDQRGYGGLDPRVYGGADSMDMGGLNSRGPGSMDHRLSEYRNISQTSRLQQEAGWGRGLEYQGSRGYDSGFEPGFEDYRHTMDDEVDYVGMGASMPDRGHLASASHLAPASRLPPLQEQTGLSGTRKKKKKGGLRRLAKKKGREEDEDDDDILM